MGLLRSQIEHAANLGLKYLLRPLDQWIGERSLMNAARQ
jgi:hypothetical protein